MAAFIPRASLFLTFACAAGLLTAQNHTPLSGPVAGIVSDAPTRSLRAVVGILGSAFLGSPVFDHFEAAFVSPPGHAIVFQEGECFAVSQLLSDKPMRFAVPACPKEFPEAVSWSPDGATAVLRNGSRLQVISGLPGSPVAGAHLVLDGPVLSVVAAGPGGRRIFIGLGGDQPGVFEVGEGGELTPALEIQSPKLMSSSPAGDSILVWDDTTRLLYVRRADSTTSTYQLNAIEDPVALQYAITVHGRPVTYVASGRERTLAVFDGISFELLSKQDLRFEPTSMEPLGNEAYILRPRKAEDEPLWSFAKQTDPRVHFVPAVPLTAQKTGAVEGLPR